VKKFILPVAVGVVVFGAVTAFAATLNVNTDSLGAGNATVAACKDAAAVTYNTSLVAGSYVVTTAPVTTSGTGAGCAGKSFKVTLLGASNAVLREVTGTLDASGNAAPDFSPVAAVTGPPAVAAIPATPAHDVSGIAVVITG
jgi:hypothetical protein